MPTSRAYFLPVSAGADQTLSPARTHNGRQIKNVRKQGSTWPASPPREARTSGTVTDTRPLVLASRCGLAGHVLPCFRTLLALGKPAKDAFQQDTTRQCLPGRRGAAKRLTGAGRTDAS